MTWSITLNNIWWLLIVGLLQDLATTNSQNWARQQCQTTYLGGGQLTNTGHHENRWFLCAHDWSDFSSGKEVSWLCLHWWYRSLCLWPSHHQSQCVTDDATASQQLGRTFASHGWGSSPNQMFLVSNRLSMEKWTMVIFDQTTATWQYWGKQWTLTMHLYSLVRSTWSMPYSGSLTSTRQQLGDRTQLLTLGESRLEGLNGGSPEFSQWCNLQSQTCGLMETHVSIDNHNIFLPTMSPNNGPFATGRPGLSRSCLDIPLGTSAWSTPVWWPGNPASLYQTDIGTRMYDPAVRHWQVRSHRVSTAHGSGSHVIGSQP